MLEFIAKYWLECFLGLIASGLGIVCKRFYTLYKNEKNHQKTKEQKEFYDGLQKLIIKGDEALQKQIDVIKAGILSIQGRSFKKECHELLERGHEITIEQYEALQKEHRIYNSLGGNSDGDDLFNMVTEKATNNIANQ